MNDVGVIIVDYRSDPLLERAFEGISASVSSLSVEVIVVENNPTGPRPDTPKGLNVRFLRQKENLGFARAVNLARRRTEAPYFLLVNPDVYLFPETLAILYRYLEGHKEVGIVVPKLIGPNGNVQYSAREFYNLPAILLRRTFLCRFFPNHPVLRRHLMADWDHNDIREVDWALGACMMIRAEAVGDEIFDPRFFLYFEDVDLCVRMKKAGWKVVYHPEAKAIHEHRQRSRRFPFSRANLSHFVSWIKFVLKHRRISGA